ncbi:N/A [soil metagenome]
MKDKIVIITGANSGIGKAATLKFANEGYRVIMACRNLKIAKPVQEEIMATTKNQEIDLMKLDVSSFGSIRSFWDDFKIKYDKLDILIHNAGYFNHGEKVYQLSKDNIELSFATNTFGPFLMTNLLMEALERSDDPRILNACTTNIRHFFDPKRKIDFDNLRGEFKESRPYNVYKNYGDSKMALLMLTFKMAEEYKNKGIKINAVQIPAIKISKDTIKKFKGFWKILAIVQNNFSQPQESMADTYFHICTSDEFKNVTGKLINDKIEIVYSSHYNSDISSAIKQFLDKKVYPRYADDKNITDKVWDLSKELTLVNSTGAH